MCCPGPAPARVGLGSVIPLIMKIQQEVIRLLLGSLGTIFIFMNYYRKTKETSPIKLKLLLNLETFPSSINFWWGSHCNIYTTTLTQMTGKKLLLVSDTQ